MCKSTNGAAYRQAIRARGPQAASDWLCKQLQPLCRTLAQPGNTTDCHHLSDTADLSQRARQLCRPQQLSYVAVHALCPVCCFHIITRHGCLIRKAEQPRNLAFYRCWTAKSFSEQAQVSVVAVHHRPTRRAKKFYPTVVSRASKLRGHPTPSPSVKQADGSTRGRRPTASDSLFQPTRSRRSQQSGKRTHR